MGKALKVSECPYKEQCQVQQIGDLADNAELIRELVCDGEPRECKTFLRLQEQSEKSGKPSD